MAQSFSDIYCSHNDPDSENYELGKILVEDSKVQRPGGILKDVVLNFFVPRDLQQAELSYRMTIDVGHIHPVVVGGEPTKWFSHRN